MHFDFDHEYAYSKDPFTHAVYQYCGALFVAEGQASIIIFYFWFSKSIQFFFSLLFKYQASFPVAKWRCVHGDFEIANGQVQVKNWLNWNENDFIESFEQKNICFEMMSIASIAQLTSSDSLNFTVRMPFYEWIFSFMSSLKYLNLVIIGSTQIISKLNLCAQVWWCSVMKKRNPNWVSNEEIWFKTKVKNHNQNTSIDR